MTTTTTKASVVLDLVSWNERVEGTVPPVYNHVSAFRGDVVDLPDAEFKRLEALGAVVKGDPVAAALEAWDASAGPYEPGAEGDAELGKFSAADLIAYVTQHPGEAQRVHAIESARKSPRVSVIKGIGYDPETGEPVAGGAY